MYSQVIHGTLQLKRYKHRDDATLQGYIKQM